MSRFVLVFDRQDIHSRMGSAWVGVNPQEHDGKPVVTHDGGTPQEFERAISDLKAELDNVLRLGKAKFAKHWNDKMKSRS